MATRRVHGNAVNHTPPGMTELRPVYLPEETVSGVLHPNYEQDKRDNEKTLGRISDDRALHGLLKRHPDKGFITVKSGHTYSSDIFELQLAADPQVQAVEVAVMLIEQEVRQREIEHSEAARRMAENKIHWYHIQEAVRHRKRQIIAEEMKPQYEAVTGQYNPTSPPNERKDILLRYLDVLSTDRNLYDLLTDPELGRLPEQGGAPGWNRLIVEFHAPGGLPIYEMQMSPRAKIPDGDERLMDIRFIKREQYPGSGQSGSTEFPSREAVVVDLMNNTGKNMPEIKASVDAKWHEKWKGYESLVRQRDMQNM